MAKIKDLTGKVFSRLTVIEKMPHVPCERIQWKCLCECGEEKIVKGIYLTTGKTKSCGCFQQEMRGASSRTHGMSQTREFVTWVKMRRRCSNKIDSRFASYGGRGITVCEDWDASFEAFYRDMGDRPSSKHSLDRKDNDGNYCPENCRWATAIEQNNNKRTNRMLTLGNITDTMSNWSRVTGINLGTLHTRLKTKGWSVERTLTAEVGA